MDELGNGYLSTDLVDFVMPGEEEGQPPGPPVPVRLDG